MSSALKYLSRMADAIFESQMQRAAVRITARQHVFRRRPLLVRKHHERRWRIAPALHKRGGSTRN